MPQPNQVQQNQPVSQTTVQGDEPSNGLGIASLIFSILGIMTPFVGILLSILGIVFGVMQKKRNPNSIAKAGFIIGIIGLAINLFIILFLFIAFFGVLSPSKMVPEMCVVGLGFQCQDYRIESDGVSMVLMNGLGRDLDNVRIDFKGRDGQCFQSFDAGSMANMAKVEHKFPCNINKYFRADFTISYKYSGEQNENQATGRLSGKPK